MVIYVYFLVLHTFACTNTTPMTPRLCLHTHPPIHTHTHTPSPCVCISVYPHTPAHKC